MTPDLRFYFDGMAKTYRLQCLDCGDDLWRWDHALERRHIIEVADLTLSHVCGGGVMIDGNWHTYRKTVDVHVDREGEIVVTWHGTSEVVPSDDRDLIQWAFDKGREFERKAVVEWTDKHGHLRACEVADCVRKSIHLPPGQRGNDG